VLRGLAELLAFTYTPYEAVSTQQMATLLTFEAAVHKYYPNSYLELRYLWARPSTDAPVKWSQVMTTSTQNQTIDITPIALAHYRNVTTFVNKL